MFRLTPFFCTLVLFFSFESLRADIPPQPDEPPGNVLVILSNATTIGLTEPDGNTPSQDKMNTGIFGREWKEPVEALQRAGYHILYASPLGQPAQIDPFSEHPIWFNFPPIGLDLSQLNLGDVFNLIDRNKALTDGRLRDMKAFWEAAKAEKGPGSFSEPFKLKDLADELDTKKENALLANVQVLFTPGGHAPAVDLVNNESLGKILNYAVSHPKVVSEKKLKVGTVIGEICHAGVTLLSAIVPGKEFAFKGLPISVASTAEEDVYTLARSHEGISRLLDLMGKKDAGEAKVLKAGQRIAFEVRGKTFHYVDQPLVEVGGMVLRQNIIPSLPRVTWVERENKDGAYVNLASGENPSSAPFVGELLVNAASVNRLGMFRYLRGLNQAELARVFNEETQEPTVIPVGDSVGLGLLASDSDPAAKEMVKFVKKIPALQNLDISLNELGKLFWGGKVFSRDELGTVTLVNKLFPFVDFFKKLHLIDARVTMASAAEFLNIDGKEQAIPGMIEGQSVKVDQRKSIILDYSYSRQALDHRKRIPFFKNIVDQILPIKGMEARDGKPGVYLGRAFTSEITEELTGEKLLDQRFWVYFALQFNPLPPR